MGGVPGVAPARVLIVGGGVAGASAARVAVGMGADVVVLDRSLARLRELEVEFGRLLTTRFATSLAIEELLPEADAVIGTVLVRGARRPESRPSARSRPHAPRRGLSSTSRSTRAGASRPRSRPRTPRRRT